MKNINGWARICGLVPSYLNLTKKSVENGRTPFFLRKSTVKKKLAEVVSVEKPDFKRKQ